MKLQEPGYMTSAYWVGRGYGREGLTIYAATSTTPAYAQARKDYTYVKFAVEAGEFGVRVAPTGVLEISSSGDRDPDWRGRQRSRFGVGCDLASEFSGWLMCPHTQRGIPGSRIEDNPVVWIDLQHKRVVKAGSLKYETPDGPPLFDDRSDYARRNRKFRYSFTNQKRYKDFVKRFEPIFNEAKLRKSMMDNTPQIGWPSTASWFKEMVLDQPAVVDIESVVEATKNTQYDSAVRFSFDPLERLQQVVMALSFVDLSVKGGAWEESVKGWCADRYESDYLIYKEN